MARVLRLPAWPVVLGCALLALAGLMAPAAAQDARATAPQQAPAPAPGSEGH